MKEKKRHIFESSLLFGFTCVALCIVALNVIAAPDLIGTWDFESGVTDVWTNNLGGTAYGSATTTNDTARGNVLWMSNSDASSYVDVLHAPLLDLTDQITIAIWFYAYNGGPDILFSKGAWDKAYTARMDDQGNKINFHGRDTSSSGVSSSNALPTGKWTHLLITFDVNAIGNDTAFYTNGVLESTAEYGTALDSNASPLRFGNATSPTSWGYWNGMMDEIAVWSTPLTAAEVHTVYLLSANSKFNYSPAEVQRLFDAHDEGAGSVVQIGNQRWDYSDSLSASSDGELVFDNGVTALVMDSSAGTGMVLTAAPDLVGVWDFETGVSDVWTNNLGGTAFGTATNTYDSERGNILKMDNSEVSYVDVPHNSLLDITDHITVAAWFYAINGGPDVLLAKGNWDNSYSIRLDDGLRNHINFHGRSASNGGGVSSSNAVPIGEWVHLIVTFHKSETGNDTAFYTNGVLESTIEYGAALDSNTYSLKFGSLIILQSWERWNGMMDDIAIWNDSLTSAMVRSVYSLSIEPDLKYSPAEAQQLFNLYAKGSNEKLVIGDCTWRYATGLSASESGELQVLSDGSGYEIVLNNTTGEGLKGFLPQGTIILIQ